MISPIDIERIEKKALSERRTYELGDLSPIGEKIFSIIENTYSSFILLYPLRTKKVAGFTRKQGDVIQIFINTSFNTSFQVFVAAHELYHLIDFKENNKDNFVVCNNQDVSENIDDIFTSIDETKANYFAAAFLLPRSVIKVRFSNLKSSNFIEEDIILEIIKLQYEYEVPYKTILKRLKELRIIENSEFQKLLGYEDQVLEYCKMLDEVICKRVSSLEQPSSRKYHTLNVPKMAFDAYRCNIITVSKLESIISKYDKSLSNFKVAQPKLKPIDIDFSNFGAGDDEDEG